MAGMERERQRLGRFVTERRQALGLSISAAARQASSSRQTWTAVEDGTRETEDYKYGLIEVVLGWAPGSIADILAGGQPTLAEAATTTPTASEVHDEAIVRVMNSDRISEEQKRKIVAILIEDRQREHERRIALADDLIRTWEDTG
jgi:hypothetical protein